MRRSLRLQVRRSRALFDEVCAKAAEAFKERRFRDALAIYEDFAKEHPDVLAEQVQLRIRALKEYIEDHVEKRTGASPSPVAPSGSGEPSDEERQPPPE